ncbi:uncharacterized protein LOC135691291 [Rhopilema esculentum]|uniref:uncharacterized protein LOC135691291 n=1 Tax=Rhopilema esculentum TaxID=499914 RepID=UPI0031D354DA
MTQETGNGESGRKIKRALRKRKQLFVVLSLLIAIASAGLILYDIIAIKARELPQRSTQSFTLILLFVHLFGFYFAILGHIYCTLARGTLLIFLSIAGILSNLASFLVRFAIEIFFIEYRKELHNPG